MKKYILVLAVILIFATYVIYAREDDDDVKVVAPAGITTIPSTTPTTTTALYKDGTYTGDVTDAYFGNLQVQAIVTGGKLTDVKFLQYPNDRDTSTQINTQAMPYLKAEAIAKQNANVNIVTGATQSSEAFNVSLASALVQAKN